MKPLIIAALIVITGLFACQQNKDQRLTIQSEKILDSIPSGSGLVIKNNSAFIISDDGTGVYQLDLDNYHQTKIPIAGLASNQYQEPKPIKHDFESACVVQWKGNEFLVSFGSGSNSTSRDSLLMMNTSSFSDQKIISLHNFYQKMQMLTQTDSTQWNIEGATMVKDRLFICNRGNNQIISCKLNEFLSWLLESNHSFPPISFDKITLPSINNRQARLSGLCTLDETRLLFCASVEDTPDWTKDGPVLGSYIGIYSISQKKPVVSYLLKNKNGKALKQKIESVDILKEEGNDDLILLAIGDNDNGASVFFQLKMQMK